MRLIDVDALPRTQVVERERLFKNGRMSMGHVISSVVRVGDLEKAPTVDAVEVVRCKECKYLYSAMDDYCCKSHRGLARICENSFCSYGERRSGDDER